MLFKATASLFPANILKIALSAKFISKKNYAKMREIRLKLYIVKMSKKDDFQTTLYERNKTFSGKFQCGFFSIIKEKKTTLNGDIIKNALWSNLPPLAQCTAFVLNVSQTVSCQK